ncbi:hypothetical protein CLV98_1266 [Dyadobacter jejuensis]|uniref:Uncharacterized protein n=1 Tax=Dyadobacter jejuensis TaxID=1082580 RepID=A0A316ASL9_9BACT|nr:hypothetical protein [Dyadobacter jejuensis]PWJ53097.1 hypothetical protein CLV98_1266 [Dyadobacter jejuensis]
MFKLRALIVYAYVLLAFTIRTEEDIPNNSWESELSINQVIFETNIINDSLLADKYTKATLLILDSLNIYHSDSSDAAYLLKGKISTGACFTSIMNTAPLAYFINIKLVNSKTGALFRERDIFVKNYPVLYNSKRLHDNMLMALKSLLND